MTRLDGYRLLGLLICAVSAGLTVVVLWGLAMFVGALEVGR